GTVVAGIRPAGPAGFAGGEPSEDGSPAVIDRDDVVGGIDDRLARRLLARQEIVEHQSCGVVVVGRRSTSEDAAPTGQRIASVRRGVRIPVVVRMPEKT